MRSQCIHVIDQNCCHTAAAASMCTHLCKHVHVAGAAAHTTPLHNTPQTPHTSSGDCSRTPSDSLAVSQGYGSSSSSSNGGGGGTLQPLQWDGCCRWHHPKGCMTMICSAPSKQGNTTHLASRLPRVTRRVNISRVSNADAHPAALELLIMVWAPPSTWGLGVQAGAACRADHMGG